MGFGIYSDTKFAYLPKKSTYSGRYIWLKKYVYITEYNIAVVGFYGIQQHRSLQILTEKEYSIYLLMNLDN